MRRNLSVPLGVILIASAVLFNVWLLEATIFPRGTISGTSRRATALLGVQATLAVGGLGLLTVRPRVTSVHLTAFALAGSVAALAGAILLQLVYVPPPIVSGWKAFAPPDERNQLGFRGRAIEYRDEDYVVLLLGDSQVEAMGLPYSEMPELWLETYLSVASRARVFTVGAGAYGTDQELLALREYLAQYRADLVVLWQTPSNDIWNNLFNTQMASRNPKPTFWLNGEGHLQGPSEYIGQPLANSSVAIVALFQRAFWLPWRDVQWERSLPEPYQPMTQYDGPIQMDWQQRWETNLGRMRDEELDTEKTHLAVALTPRSKRMQYGLDLTRSLTSRIEEVVASQGGRLVLLQTDPPRDDANGEEVYLLNGKYYRTSERQARENWQYVNDGFASEFVPITIADWRISPEDAHLNQRATKQTMMDLAGRLRSRMTAPARASAAEGPQ